MSPRHGALDADVAALGTPDDEITTVVDVAEHLPARERAIAVHSSQTSPFEGLPDDLRRAFLATDRLRRVVPASPGSDPETRLLDRHPRHETAMTTPLATRPSTDARTGPAHRPVDPSSRATGTGRCWWDVARARWVCDPGPTP